MGQQQLLLVILVTIVVGIATVVAINTFGAAADSANMDAVRQDLVSMAAAAQGYHIKPTMLGGGGRSFNDITFHSLAFAGIIVQDDLGKNENGTYEITSTDDITLTLTAYASNEDGYDGINGPETFTAEITANSVNIQPVNQ